MNLIFRLAAVLAGALFGSRMGITETAQLRGRVWPLDLDFNLHMTNSRYLALADLGRLDLILRSGTWRVMWRGKLGVVLGGTTIRFRRSLQPFEPFTLRTEIIGWDERWVYLRQTFTGRAGVACIAMMRTGFTRRGSLVAPQEIIDAVAGPAEKLRPPAWIAIWDDLESAYLADAGFAGHRDKQSA